MYEPFSNQNKKDSIITGFGCSTHSMIEKRLPTRKELDSAEQKKPVFIIKYDGHAGVGNSAFIKKIPSSILKLRRADPN